MSLITGAFNPEGMNLSQAPAAMDRAIEAAFRLGFGNALAEVDGDLHPFGHGRRRRCCAACSVLANATAKFQDGRYPWAAPPTVETLEAVQKHKERGNDRRGV